MNTQCSEGCSCIDCGNIHVQAEECNTSKEVHKSELQEIALEEHISSTILHDSDDANELMDWIFGSVEPTSMDDASTLNISEDSRA